MDEFHVPIAIDKFKKTNLLWNQLMLNDPWSVGYVSQLIELKTFKNKEDWENFYFEMGADRQRKIALLSEPIQTILNDEQLIKTNKKFITQLPKEIIKLNKLHGRTANELNKKGSLLYLYVKNTIPNITEEECQKAVVYRVIGETWNGIFLREKNTVLKLREIFPLLNFIKKSGEFDFKYAVDFEVYNKKTLICGIQIKPKSYTYNTTYLNSAKKANAEKNRQYTSSFKAPVFNIISNTKGEIYNENILKNIRLIIQ